MKGLLVPPACVLALLLSACVSNPYRQFYSPATYTTQPSYLPYSGKTDIFASEDPRRDADILIRKGYDYLGVSAFEGGGAATEAQLREHAKEIGADVVLTKVDFQGSQQSTIPWITYNPGTTSTTTSSGTASANVYNNRGGTAYGNAIYSGTSTTTTPGTYSTQMIPVTVNRYKWESSFWRKGSTPVFGVRCSALPDEMRQRLQRNTGALVRIVIDDSPAFRANVLPGDIITAIGEETAITETGFSAACRKYADQKVTIELIRGEETKQIEVKMNQIAGSSSPQQNR